MAFSVLLLVAAAVLVRAGTGLTFFFDEWEILLGRDGSSVASLLEPHNGQTFLVPVLVYKALLSVFGMSSQLPFRLTSVVVASTCAVLLFVHARRSAGGWMALVAVTPVLFLGAGWEALLLPLSLNFLVSLAAGLGMLILLDRDGLEGDVPAAILLALSLASGGLGVAFLAGATVDVALRRNLRAPWIPALPLLLFALWSIGYGGDATSSVTASNLIGLPEYLFEASRSVITSVAGMFDAPLAVTTIITLLAGAALAARMSLAKTPVSRRAWVAGAVLLAFWVLAGLATSEGREAVASRYQYPGAVLLVGFSLALLEGLSVPRLLPILCVPVVVFSVTTNLSKLDGGQQMLLAQSEITRGALGALEAEDARDLPGLNLGAAAGGSRYLSLITAGAYFRAVDRYGSPAGPGIRPASPEARLAAVRVSKTISDYRQAGDGDYWPLP